MAVPFDAAKARDTLVREIRKFAREQGFERVALGISGGKDSTVTAALCARALGKENVYGVMMPDGEQKDLDDSRRVCEALGIRKKTVNIGAMHRALRAETDRLAAESLENVQIHQNKSSFISTGVTGEITVSGSKLLCLTIPYSDGWKAYVDGSPAVLENVNLMFSGLWLSSGHHTIELHYETPGLLYGLCLSAAGLLLLIFWMVLSHRASKRRDPEDSEEDAESESESGDASEVDPDSSSSGMPDGDGSGAENNSDADVELERDNGTEPSPVSDEAPDDVDTGPVPDPSDAEPVPDPSDAEPVPDPSDAESTPDPSGAESKPDPSDVEP